MNKADADPWEYIYSETDSPGLNALAASIPELALRELAAVVDDPTDDSMDDRTAGFQLGFSLAKLVFKTWPAEHAMKRGCVTLVVPETVDDDVPEELETKYYLRGDPEGVRRAIKVAGVMAS